ncbi:MAG TPA: cyclic pyranopterin monophosphate synthase MoaC [Salinivirgaceae bacterium]|nr:cyclic pyranopterin monophosphate synthase MoaC [Salinivirgaceae bacterium]
MKKKTLTHTNEQGKANMVDVGSKTIQRRIARARGFIELQPETIALIRENQMKKGDVLSCAQIAGIMAAKQTANLIPLCHPIFLTKIEVDCNLVSNGVEVIAEAIAVEKTGVEMEALTAVNIALLTIYDMCKAVDKSMIIKEIYLLEKQKQDLD